ncbi:enoyl-CoA hydratase-related protein [Nocardia sp. NPDC020380]|uniref:enoyl-CoA hydratase-related protein n=1 Tax=Nocardia sp. NPDC020380 TaxID=3364309 RepID=UPI0037882ED0
MSREIAERWYRALADGDRETLGKVLHPDLEVHVTPGMPLGLGGVHRGARAALRDFWGVIARHYRARAVPATFDALSDGRLLVTGRYTGKALGSGKPLDAEFTHLLTFTDGRIIRIDQLTDSRRWLDALAEDGPLDTIDYTGDNGVATLTLNRPTVRNAINLQLAEEFLIAARRCAADDSIRALLIKGNGPAFTVGGDISYFNDWHGPYGDLFRRMTGPFHEAFRILSRIDAPIITAVHGSIAGGGLGFAYIADFVLAAEGTKFATGFAAIGLSGDGGGTWFLPRLVGPRRAAQMYLRNRVLNAQEAVDWGIATEVVPPEELDTRAISLARELAAGPTAAFGRMRALLRDSWGNSLSEQLLAETEALAETGDSADAAKAIESFAAKRSPDFDGR